MWWAVTFQSWEGAQRAAAQLGPVVGPAVVGGKLHGLCALLGWYRADARSKQGRQGDRNHETR